MNFSGPEKNLKLNLWPHLGSLFDFSHLLSDEFYHSKQFENQTCEKVDFKKRAFFSKILFCAGGGIGVVLSNVALRAANAKK